MHSPKKVHLDRRLQAVMRTLLSEKTIYHVSLFHESEGRQRAARLMAAVDAINQESGRNTLRADASEIANTWAMRARDKSPCYTIHREGLPAVFLAFRDRYTDESPEK